MELGNRLRKPPIKKNPSEGGAWGSERTYITKPKTRNQERCQNNWLDCQEEGKILKRQNSGQKDSQNLQTFSVAKSQERRIVAGGVWEKDTGQGILTQDAFREGPKVEWS